MKETILITGGNSFIASHLIPILQKKYHVKLLTRSPKNENEFKWDVHNKFIDEKALDDINYIVHLAGSKLNDGTPLTEERKKEIYESRIGAANFIREELKKRNQKLKSFISASAIGYYGFNDNLLEIDENGKKGYGFAAELSDDWEKAADKFKTDNIAENVVKIRVALVLGTNGGIFPVYKNIVKQNPNIIFNTDHGAVPWNHIEDMARIFAFAVDKNLNGVFNCVAPNPASQQDIYKAISNELNLNDNQNISKFVGPHLVSKKIQNEGFVFKYPNIEAAIKNLISN